MVPWQPEDYRGECKCSQKCQSSTSLNDTRDKRFLVKYYISIHYYYIYVLDVLYKFLSFCRVCGVIETHLATVCSYGSNYGAITCKACALFFRRQMLGAHTGGCKTKCCITSSDRIRYFSILTDTGENVQKWTRVFLK